MRRTLYVYEHVSAGGIDDPCLEESLRREGRAMLDAVVEDLRALEDIDVISCLDGGPGAATEAILIAPEVGGALSRLAEEFRAAQITPLVSDAETIKLASDKLSLALHLEERGIPCIPARRARAGERLSEATVLKPRFGAGSQGILSLDASQIVPACSDEMIVTPRREGIAASVLLLCTTDRPALPLPACAQKLARDGSFRYLGGTVPLGDHLGDDLDRRARKLATSAISTLGGAQGFLGVDMLLSMEEADGTCDEVVEINPRLTTSYCGLRRLASTNLAGALLNLVHRKEVAPPSFRPGIRVDYDTGGTFTETMLSERET